MSDRCLGHYIIGFILSCRLWMFFCPHCSVVVVLSRTFTSALKYAKTDVIWHRFIDSFCAALLCQRNGARQNKYWGACLHCHWVQNQLKILSLKCIWTLNTNAVTKGEDLSVIQRQLKFWVCDGRCSEANGGTTTRAIKFAPWGKSVQPWATNSLHSFSQVFSLMAVN